MSGWRREGCRITASPDIVENLSRRFQTGGSFFDARALRVEDPSPGDRFLANEEVDVRELLRF